MDGAQGALISQPLIPIDNTELRIGKGFTIKLAANSDVEMVKKDSTTTVSNVTITGGIWDMNGANQTRNDAGGYIGSLMELADIDNLVIKDLTLKNPVSFGIQIGDINRFEIGNIYCDYDNSRANMDGVHVNGGCFDGDIYSIKGQTNDDMVALNADDGSQYQLRAGAIRRVTVRDIKCDGDGYRGVRLLSGGSIVDDITIDGVHGNYRNAAVAITIYTFPSTDFHRVTLKNINAAMTTANEPMILVEGNVSIRNLIIDGMQVVVSSAVQKEFMEIEEGAEIESLTFSNVQLQDLLGMPAIVTNRGYVRESLFENWQIEVGAAVTAYPFFSVASGGAASFGQVTVRDVQCNKLSSLLNCLGGANDKFIADNVRCSTYTGSPFRVLAGATLDEINVSGGALATTTGNPVVECTGAAAHVEVVRVSNFLSSSSSDFVGTYTSGQIDLIILSNNKIAATQDIVHLEGDAANLVTVMASDNSWSVGAGRYKLFQTGQPLRVNSSQIPIDRDLVTNPGDGDVVLNSDATAAAVGLWSWVGGAWA
jgi:hypothetical protein